MPRRVPTPFKDKVAIVAALVALAISLITFFKDNIFGQRVLQASVVTYGGSRSGEKKMVAQILLVNSGKHTEVLYSAVFLITKSEMPLGGVIPDGTHVAHREDITEPIVLEPGKAQVITMTSNQPQNWELTESLPAPTEALFYVSVYLSPLLPSGRLSHRIMRAGTWRVLPNGYDAQFIPAEGGLLTDLL